MAITCMQLRGELWLKVKTQRTAIKLANANNKYGRGQKDNIDMYIKEKKRKEGGNSQQR